MLGAIVGDVVGSIYEWHNIKTKNFPLFQARCFFTDDTVMTVAVAEAVASDGDFAYHLRQWGRRYPGAGYGGRFGAWLCAADPAPYGSWGNGSAMRVSPCAWAVPCDLPLEEGLQRVGALAEASAAVTHDHEEGIRGAVCTARAIWLMRRGRREGRVEDYRARVRAEAERCYGGRMARSLDQIRPHYRFDESCQGTVPEAIIAFLEADGFEDAIRNAISLGGDSDTLAAITGSIAEGAWGVPDWIRERAESYLDAPLLKALREAALLLGLD